MNHLWPLTIHLPPFFTALVRIIIGSEPEPGCGSVMIKEERIAPSAVNRVRSHAPQNGRETLAITPTFAGPPSTSQVSAGAAPSRHAIARPGSP